jgi:hypothetical protein
MAESRVTDRHLPLCLLAESVSQHASSNAIGVVFWKRLIEIRLLPLQEHIDATDGFQDDKLKVVLSVFIPGALQVSAAMVPLAQAVGMLSPPGRQVDC